MRTSIYRRKRTLLSLMALIVIGLASSAFASLGGDASSVEADRAKMQASLQTTDNKGYTVHEIHSQNRQTVREYVSPAGKVFGVSWSGPFLPDMQQILGDYFPQYTSAAKSGGTSLRGHRQFRIDQPNFVLHSSGHMGFYSGKAYDPSLLPQGVTANDVQ